VCSFILLTHLSLDVQVNCFNLSDCNFSRLNIIEWTKEFGVFQNGFFWGVDSLRAIKQPMEGHLSEFQKHHPSCAIYFLSQLHNLMHAWLTFGWQFELSPLNGLLCDFVGSVCAGDTCLRDYDVLFAYNADAPLGNDETADAIANFFTSCTLLALTQYPFIIWVDILVKIDLLLRLFFLAYLLSSMINLQNIVINW
jgi:hypothetical protein